MNVVIGSMFRDSAKYLDGYVLQIKALRALLEDRGDTLRWVAVENDSVDDTAKMLDDRTHEFVDAVQVTVHDDCPYFPSVDAPERWRHHAWVQNHVLTEIDDHDDVVLYAESDLVWMAEDLITLLDQVEPNRAMTAGVYHGQQYARWYDSWGATKDGINFSGYEPYHPVWQRDLPIRLDTCASVLACPARLAAKTRFQPEDAFKGWCRDIYAHGGEVWLDPRLAVIHP